MSTLITAHSRSGESRSTTWATLGLAQRYAVEHPQPFLVLLTFGDAVERFLNPVGAAPRLLAGEQPIELTGRNICESRF